MFRNKSPSDELFLHFSSKLQNLTVFSFFHDSNSIFRAPGINSEWVSARIVIRCSTVWRHGETRRHNRTSEPPHLPSHTLTHPTPPHLTPPHVTSPHLTSLSISPPLLSPLLPLHLSSRRTTTTCLRRWFDSGYMCMRWYWMEAFWKKSTQFQRVSAIRLEFGQYSAIPWYLAPACSVSVSSTGLLEFLGNCSTNHFYGPLYLTVIVWCWFRREVQESFLGDDFRSCVRIRGPAVDTCAHASVCGFGEN